MTNQPFFQFLHRLAAMAARSAGQVLHWYCRGWEAVAATLTQWGWP